MLDYFFDLNSAASTFVGSSENPLGMSIRGQEGIASRIGSEKTDSVLGTDGADSLYGAAGADYLYGGFGADQLWGGRGGDLLGGNQGPDQISGQRGNDVIFGGPGSDLLLGGEGDDFLAGDAGADTLTGGDGSDAFVLDIRQGTSDRALVDVMTDFSPDDGDVFALTDGGNDALTEADLTLEAVGTDTLITLKATGAILARVQGVSPEQLAGTFSTARATRDDTESGATVLQQLPGQTTVQGEVGDADYQDMFQFRVTDSSIVNFRLNNLSVDADLVLYQDLDADGELGEDEIISASSRSGNADETIENVTLKQGQYFLAVEQFEGDTSYNLSVAGVAGTVAQDLAGSQPSTARLLPPDGEVELHDYVGGSDAVDTYRLEVLNEGYLDLFTDYQDADLNLTLWSDRNGNNQLDTNETIAQGTNEIQQNSIDAGTYYVNVTAPSSPTPYEILSIASSGSRVDIESYDPLFPGVPTTGTLSQNDDFNPNSQDNYADLYLLPELAAGLTVTVTQQSEDFDADLQVVDLLTGEVVAENDDIDTAAGNFDAQVSFTTEQGGQYVVYASSVDAPGIGDYTLNTTVTGTSTQTAARSTSGGNNVSSQGGANAFSSGSIQAMNSSSGSILPAPVFLEKADRADTGLKQDTRHNLVYQPLNGGEITSIKVNNLNQGTFGDCAFLAALTATFGKIEPNLSNANSKESTVLNNAIKTNGDNNYTLAFYNYQTGQLGNVTVDNQVVIATEKITLNPQGQIVKQESLLDNQNLFGAKWDNDNVTFEQASGQPIWASIFERAYAQRRGEETNRNGYDVMRNGDQVGRPLRRVTGQAIQNIYWDPSQADPAYSLVQLENETDGQYNSLGSVTPDQMFEQIKTALDQGRYAVAGTETEADQRSEGVLVGGHAYSIHNAYVDANNQKMILLRNPWGNDNKNDKIAPEDINPNAQDGFVTISFERFLNNFGTLSLSL